MHGRAPACKPSAPQEQLTCERAQVRTAQPARARSLSGGGLARALATCAQWWRNAKMVGPLLRHVQSLVDRRGDLPLQKTIFCLATLLSRLLMLRSAVRGLRLIDTPRRGARDLSCLHGRDCAARKVRASASEVKDGGGYDHPLTHGPVFQRDKRIIERLAPSFGDSAPRKCRPEAAAPERSVPIIAVLELTSLYPLRPPADDLLPR